LGGFAIVILNFSTRRFEALLFNKSGRYMQHLFYFICRINAISARKSGRTYFFTCFTGYFSNEASQNNHSPSQKHFNEAAAARFKHFIADARFL